MAGKAMARQAAEPLIGQGLMARLRAAREGSEALCAPLSDADQSVQSMADASPAKWHLAHTTWFFEAFVLRDHLPGYQPFDERFFYLFNSYYEHEGARHPRPRRGMLTRPSADRILDYRHHVEAGLDRLLAAASGADAARIGELVELGINHEQQHQELLLTDILHLFAQNPLEPAYGEGEPPAGQAGPVQADRWRSFGGGIVRIGHSGGGFCYDNETPAHDALGHPFRLADALVTNGDWLAFMADGGYRTATLWLSDGWAQVQGENWQAPLYWQEGEDGWSQMSLWGRQPVDPRAPACHVSYYEADAFARWAGKRLPNEFEWEVAAREVPVRGNLGSSGQLRPLAAGHHASGARQMFGDVWEWTASPYTAYPGFAAAKGAVGEYNGKFMCNQMVLRGGSCVTPEGHVRASYRNFFYPHQRWQFMGLRLAEDG